MKAIIASLLTLLSCGCILRLAKPITCDPEVDPRLEGIWVLEEDADDDDIGTSCIIFRKIDEARYKVIALDGVGNDRSEANILEFFASTRKHDGCGFLSLRIPPYVKDSGSGIWTNGIGDWGDKAWLLDYAVGANGDLTLRLPVLDDDLEKLREIHPVSITMPEGDFAPATLTGSEEEILKFYSDPKVREHFTSAGRYRRIGSGPKDR